ncbi:hypothetical protein ACS4Y5_18020 [Salmonella enterica]|uniref:hypothetical protein n=1 Tax=Salmonella enterica TaxID=28901 RepID=UPI003F428ED2
MSDFIKYLFIFPCLWCANSFAITQTQWDGNFRVEELGEQLNDGSQVFLQYNLKIDSKNNRASLSMTTWHAGITCIGDYSLKINLVFWHYTITATRKMHVHIHHRNLR